MAALHRPWDEVRVGDPRATAAQHGKGKLTVRERLERGLVDDVIDPALTRQTLIAALEMLRAKHAPLPARKHGNPPT
ncbi:hypothetical protein JK363_23990 [Streptomyces sp. 205]|uniref:Acetyl-coenzyme A carboxylase carboxyl transferase subunit beta domain-containing protein n=1 Tax=Streptomyces coffeae TaxID=621382 RepID=A0ABS1NI41_9ACTN|nr:carboxyl transferase domain-containing protein [Streptomyces coffeae]MBL1099673.1 hypothetical protein [Streptomyces coffeae]